MTRAKRARPGTRRKRPPARLVRFEETRRKSVRDLGDGEVRIGRDPTCDWIVDYANVSRQHAVVRPLGDRNVVQDLGSTNGVRVNGSPLGGKPHVLAPGDVIELTEAVVLLYEEGPFSSSTPWVVTAIAMILLLIASVGLYFSTRGEPAGAAHPEATGATHTQNADGRGPESGAAGTHPGMRPPESPPSRALKRPPLPAVGAPLRSGQAAPTQSDPPEALPGPGDGDWTVAGRVPSSGERRPGSDRAGDSL